jgi:hypothetical protein
MCGAMVLPTGCRPTAAIDAAVTPSLPTLRS